MKPTKFMPAEDKEKVLKSWNRFIKSDFDRKYFAKCLYDHLHLHCSFIAHFNQQGFYSSYFEDPEQTMKFIKQLDNNHACVSVEYNSTHWLTRGGGRGLKGLEHGHGQEPRALQGRPLREP